MARAGIGVVQKPRKGHASFRFKRKREAAGQLVLIYCLCRSAVNSFIKQCVREQNLQVPGFRKAKASAHNAYQHHKSYIDSRLVSLLRSSNSDDINSRMRKAATPLGFKVLPWNMEGDFVIEVSSYLTPSIPNPGRRFNGAATPGTSADDLEPAAGQQHGIAGTADRAVTAMSERGVFIGSNLLKQQPAGVGLHVLSRLDNGDEEPVAGQLQPDPGSVRLPEESLFSSAGSPMSKAPTPDVVSPDAGPALPETQLGLEQESATRSSSKQADQLAESANAAETSESK